MSNAGSLADTVVSGTAAQAETVMSTTALVDTVMNTTAPADTVGVVVLTQGRRPTELRAALDSVLAQQGVILDVVVVGNGWDPSCAQPPMPPGVNTTIALGTNQGIPAGRNAGATELNGRRPGGGIVGRGAETGTRGRADRWDRSEDGFDLRPARRRRRASLVVRPTTTTPPDASRAHRSRFRLSAQPLKASGYSAASTGTVRTTVAATGTPGATTVFKNRWMLFLDDDATIVGPNFLRDAIAAMRADPSIGLLQPRVEVHDKAGHVVPTPGRWIPRLRKGDPRQSGPIMSCWEGAIVMPTSVFYAAGGWTERFFYAHEGIELAWRVWGLGLRAWYAGELTATHPEASPTRHSQYYRLNARNRVWIARRNLPFLLGLGYIANWTLIQLLRGWRNPATLATWFAGWREGWRVSPGGRRLLSWRTIYRMTRAGRPPII